MLPKIPKFLGSRPTWISITCTFHDFRSGEIYENLGEMDKAVENYRRFIEYWKDCDPELRPMVEDAQARLALLQGEGT